LLNDVFDCLFCFVILFEMISFEHR
jgi:hypothetical protein